MANDNIKAALRNVIRQLSTITADPNNTASNTAVSGTGITFPSLSGSLDLGSINIGDLLGGGSTIPSSLRQLLNSLLNETVSVTVPFQTLTGTLIAVRSDYIVLVEPGGTIVEVPIANIELLSET